MAFNFSLAKYSRIDANRRTVPPFLIDPVATKLVMDTIIAANIFAGSNFVSAKEVRLVEHNVTGYELV